VSELPLADAKREIEAFKEQQRKDLQALYKEIGL
jgi:hypothetical protein